MTVRISGEPAPVGAWLVALGAALAVLSIREVLGQMPCLLCRYQRAVMFPIAINLGLGLWRDDTGVGRYAVVLSLGGGAIALCHRDPYAATFPDPIQPCRATGPSLRDNNQLIVRIPIVLFVAAGWYVSHSGPVTDVATAPREQIQPLRRHHSPIPGPQDTAATIVEFFDAACKPCRAYDPVVKEIMTEQPLWASHSAPEPGMILQIAGSAWLDVAAAQSQMPEVVAVMYQDRKDVETVGIRQAPPFRANGKPFGEAELWALVAAEVATVEA